MSDCEAAMLPFLKQRPIALSGKSALVLGGSKGLGFLIAREFAGAGADVTIAARDASELAWASAQLAAEGHSVTTAVCDVRDREMAKDLLEDVTNRNDGLDYLVNNAGVIQVGPLPALSMADFDEAMATMFWGVVTPSLAALPGMKARRSGCIINITSIGGKVSVPHLLPYNCAKFGAVGFSEGLHAELAGTGVSVVTVVPGLMRTGSFVNAQFKGNQDLEFNLFTPISSIPGFTLDAEAAAKRILRAAVNREAEVILSLPANLLVRAHGVAPGITTRIMALTARVLPGAKGETDAIEGSKLLPNMKRVPRAMSSLGRKAMQKLQPPSAREAA